MKSKSYYFLLLSLLLAANSLISKAQYGYSPLVDSLMQQITDSSLSILDRQLSGDTSVIIGGVTDTIKSRFALEPGNAKAAQFILQKFQSFGLNAYLHQFDSDGQNVVAILPGTEFPEQQYLITAHYDDMPMVGLAPGADDNASGVSAVLEAARVLSQCEFPYTIRFVAFDEEETGLIGSQAYVDYAFQAGHQILGVLNLDMIAWDSNGDNDCLVATNSSSVPFMINYIDLLRIYQPSLSTGILYNVGVSDHLRFWNKGYTALLAIEEYQGDFNPYLHNPNDTYSHINHQYFLAMARGAVAALATLAKHHTMSLQHQPLGNDLSTDPQVARLIISGPNLPDTGIFSPRLYYEVDEDTFSYINPYQSSGDTFDFLIPAFSTGSKISYYFAVQDIDGNFSVTLPEFGKGVNPPGSTPPPLMFSYYVLKDTTVTVCATGLPLSFPANGNILKTIPVQFGGRLLDVNALISINHTNLKNLDLYLIGPSGRTIKLSNKNGYTLDHYQNTEFDDEAGVMINQAIPPYTGSFRPEQPLADYDDTSVFGNWSLRIINNGSVAGSLTNFCLVLTYSAGCHYVDASLPVSGDGQTWETAFTSISEAFDMNPAPGEIVLIKPGYYPEELTITSNGEEIVPLSTGISVSDSNMVQFPQGTDLSGIDLVNFPGQYYVYLFRSRSFNNGFSQIIEVDDAADFIRVQGTAFHDESGMAGDSTVLSGAVGRPVIYRKYSLNPEEERILLDSIPSQSSNPAVYVGNPIDDGSYDAWPANYNIIDGLDMTGALTTEGLHLQSSSFNVICNSRIFDTEGAGIYINGNAEHPANYNIIIGNQIHNIATDGINIGAEGMPLFNNHSYYNHIIANDIHLASDSSYPFMHNAIHISDYNENTVIERNHIHDIFLEETQKGALDIHSYASNTLIIGNTLKNIGASNTGLNACIMVHGNNSHLEIINNVIYDSISQDNDIYAAWINGSGHENSRFVHNTIHNMDRGILLEDDASQPDFTISNNIIQANDVYFSHIGISGRFSLSHNLYFEDPSPENWMPYFIEPGRQTGPVEFEDMASGNFHLTVNSEKAICNGMLQFPPVLLDMAGISRDDQNPDIGAYELENKLIWLGVEDQDWHNPANWNYNLIPESSSNIIIPETSTYPVISEGDAYSKGVLLKPGGHLRISAGRQLINSQ